MSTRQKSCFNKILKKANDVWLKLTILTSFFIVWLVLVKCPFAQTIGTETFEAPDQIINDNSYNFDCVENTSGINFGSGLYTLTCDNLCNVNITTTVYKAVENIWLLNTKERIISNAGIKGGKLYSNQYFYLTDCDYRGWNYWHGSQQYHSTQWFTNKITTSGINHQDRLAIDFDLIRAYSNLHYNNYEDGTAYLKVLISVGNKSGYIAGSGGQRGILIGSWKTHIDEEGLYPILSTPLEGFDINLKEYIRPTMTDEQFDAVFSSASFVEIVIIAVGPSFRSGWDNWGNREFYLEFFVDNIVVYGLEKPPIASFTYSPDNPVVGNEIIFDASSSNDPDGEIVKYQWDFGDGNKIEGKVVSYTSLPSSNRLLGSYYYDVTTTSSYADSITVTFYYDDAGLTPDQESNIRIMHLQDGVWKDVTVSVDPAENEVTGQIDALSIFAVTIRTSAIDTDGDGYTENQGDCNDNDKTVNPGMTEVPYNGKDDDCNAATKDDDLDGDNYPIAADCDDNNASIYPGANDSICDDVDNDCDGAPDDGYVPTPTSCGTGACASTGQLICQNGLTIDTCKPKTPQAEGPYGSPTCSDSVDNDCDGFTDANDEGCAAPVRGNLDGDNDVDQNDLNILLAKRNQPASACPSCDLDGDGKITVLDSRKLVLLCTRPRCATE